jgi:hypothetical protein
MMTNPICPECYRLGSGHGSLVDCDTPEHPLIPTHDGECPLCGYRGRPVTRDEIDMTVLAPVVFLGPCDGLHPDESYEGEYDAV